jgi:hypothetical protein
MGEEAIGLLSRYVPPERADAVRTREIAAARIAGCQLFELLTIGTGVAQYV